VATAPHQATVLPLGRQPTDAALVDEACAGQNWARAELYLRHGPGVRRILVRILGLIPDVDDLLQEVFLAAFRDLARLRDRERLRNWLLRIAVLRARKYLRSRRRWSWLRAATAEEPDELAAPVADSELREVLRATYGIIARMGTEERLAFALRFVEGMDLLEAAAACDVSLATIKRRLKRAEELFRREAAAHPLLAQRLRGST
jgi:RNA polymerase sigma-70 factor, ECF subfamily